jgi:hypothetical protein
VELINNKRKDIASGPSDVYSSMCYIIPAAAAAAAAAGVIPLAITQEHIPPH